MSVPREPSGSKPDRNPRRARGPAKPGNKRPVLATAVPASDWPSWTDRPFDAVVGAIYVDALSCSEGR
jgi:hypothetical protein